MSKLKVWHILLILASIILFIPWLYTLTSFLPDYSFTGGVGDTIGGITAPFINGLAAILVFLAFKEQVTANELLQKQEITRTILDQIRSIRENESENFTDPISFIKENLPDLHSVLKEPLIDKFNALNLFMHEILITHKLVRELEINSEKQFYQKKLAYMFKAKYWDKIYNLEKKIYDNGHHQPYSAVVKEFNSSTEKLRDVFINSLK